MKLLIGTVNLNTRPVTDVFLKTLDKALKYLHKNSLHKVETEIVVAINGNDDNARSLIDKYPFVNKWIYSDKNLTCAVNWNSLIKHGFDSSGNPLHDFYLVLNNDLYFSEKSLFNFVEALSKNADSSIGWISFCGNDFKEVELTGMPEVQIADSIYWSLRQEADDIDEPEQLEAVINATYARFGGIDKFADNLSSRYKNQVKPMHQKAFGFALTKDCIKKVGLFDEYGEEAGLHEDADAGKRIELAGMKFAVVPGAYVHHLSMLTRTKGDFKKEWWVNAREKAFQEKWGVSSKEMHKITPETARFRLDIGSGERPQRKEGEHWYHLDIDRQFDDIEFLQNVQDLSNFEDNSIKEIYTSNVIEHIEWKQILSTLYEWHRVLDFGGKIEIRCPNATWLMKRVLEGSWNLELTEGVDFNAQHALMGGDHPGTPHLHKVLLEEGNLSRAMKEVGFINVTNVSNPSSWELQIKAEK